MLKHRLSVDYRELHKVSLDKAVNLAVHHAVHISGLVSGAVVLDATVVKHVAAYLATLFYLLLTSLNLCLCLKALLHGTVVELRFKQSHSVVAVLELLSALGIRDKYLFLLASVGVGVLVA